MTKLKCKQNYEVDVIPLNIIGLYDYYIHRKIHLWNYLGMDKIGGLDLMRPCFFRSIVMSPPANCHK